MAEAELKLMLLRYNMLSKERAKASYKCMYADNHASCRDECSEYINEMVRMRDDLREDGYEFAFADYKTAGKIYYKVYEIIPVSSQR